MAVVNTYDILPPLHLYAASVEKRNFVHSSMKIRFFLVWVMYKVPLFHRGDTEAPQRPQRPQRRKHDAFFQRGHRGRIFFLLMELVCSWCQFSSKSHQPGKKMLPPEHILHRYGVYITNCFT